MPGASFVISKVIDFCSQAILTQLALFFNGKKLLIALFWAIKVEKQYSVTCHDMEIWGCVGKISHRWEERDTCFSSGLVKKTFFYNAARKERL